MQRLFITALVCLISVSVFGQDEICPGATIEISAEGMSYSPDAAVVNVGWTVGWVNYGGNHDVNGVSSSTTGVPFSNPESFSLETVEVDSVPVCLGTHTFTIPGVYYYDCSTYGHAQQGMVANITVHLPGCTDALACNYDVAATENNESCLFIGDACDDGDENTQDDVIQEDCGCAGTLNSIVDQLEVFSVLIYPNPASNNLTIDLGALTGLNTTIKIYDSSSKLVFEKQSTSTLLIDVSGYAKGLYTLELSTSDKVLRSQVVIE